MEQYLGVGLDPSSVVSDRVDNNDSTGAKVDAFAAAAGEASVAVAAAAVEGEHGGGAGVEPATAAQTSLCGYTLLWMAPDDDSTFQERRTDKEGTPEYSSSSKPG